MILKAKSKLDAVNDCLLAIGGDVISSIDDESDTDVAGALQTLDNVSREVQLTGWKFNKRVGYRLKPGSSGEIKLPPNYLSVSTNQKNSYLNITDIAGKLYNSDTNSFEFTSDVYVDITLLFPFEELPPSARTYIAMRAARTFASTNAPDDMTYRTSSEEERTAKAAFMRDQSLKRVNILKNRYV